MAALTNLVFLPWLRRGMAASITRADTPLPAGATPQQATTFAVNITTNAGMATVNLPLVGPGDIAGLDPRVVVRTTPGKDESDAEFLHFASIEFDQADLPWRYTPAAATTGGQLHPWFTLIVLADGEWTPVAPTTAQRLPLITTDISKLPPLAPSWASAHVQLHGSAETATTQTALAGVLQGQPGLFVARLICPRILVPQTKYTAMLVPTYAHGALAGQGLPQNPNSDILDFAWTGPSGPVTLPVYYQWSFQTGVIGDFTTLAEELAPQPVAATVGRRDLDVSVPGFDLANAAPPPQAPATVSTSMPMEGALQSFQASHLLEPTPNGTWVGQLESFVNSQMTSVNGSPRMLVTPPLYGRWHAPESALGSNTHPWFFDLNTDPRNRTAAGLGTLVVEERHQDLMASAWGQIEGLIDGNAERKILQIGREAFTRIFTRHLQSGSTDTFLLILGILQRWILTATGGTTVHTAFGGSPVGRGPFDPMWRRFVRPRGPIGRRQNRHLPGKAPFVPGVVTKLNPGTFQPAPPPPPPTGIVTPSTAFPGIVPGRLTPIEITIVTSQGNDAMLFWGILLFCVARKLLVAGAGRAWWWLLRVIRFALELIRLAAGTTSTTIRISVAGGILTGPQVASAPGNGGFKGLPSVPNPIPPPPLPTGTDSPDAAAFRQAYVAMLNAYAQPQLTFVPPTPVDIAGTVTLLLAKLAPSVTLLQSTLSRLTLTFSWQPADQLDPVQAAPTFPQPMWAPLRDESVDWILPGLDQVGTNTVGLVVSNQRFIETYMVGLNHEMARTLLWNGYPTDQRGTYFQQFWDSRAAGAGDMRDIKPITGWGQTALGANSSRSTAAALVLLVRGDLIRRYPNVVVYALQPPAPPPPPAAPPPPDSALPQTVPIFSGQLTPDVAFYGFSIPQAQSGSYSFVLQEQPAEPRFSVPANVTVPPPAAGTPAYLTPDLVNASTAAAYAVATFQHPVRVVIPGSLLVPQS